MRIRIITCHDVYNAGASLQAYALMQYLKDCGHEVKIIDYKPDYLSRHYSLKAVNNPEYDRAGIREIYLLVKMPGRIKKLFSKRKYRFDAFRKNALELTDTTYRTCEELKNIEEADLYLAGSDQIWNPIFPNGKDPAFFLQFTEKGRRASYAASFAVDELKEEDRQRMKKWLKSFDAVSVREQTGAALVKQMGLQSQRNCDPVFLLKQCQWKKILPETETNKKYVLLYDFDKNCVAEEIAEKISKKTKTEIWSVFKTEICDKVSVMYAGKMVEQGPVDDIFYAPGHPYTRGLLRSMPRVDADSYERLIPIEGTPVDMLNPPEGCPFAPRCESAMKICLQKMPPYVELGENHRAACWLCVQDQIKAQKAADKNTEKTEAGSHE